MQAELKWLAMTGLMTALFWMPYVLDRMRVKGIMGAMGNPQTDDRPLAEWAQRAKSAHLNAAENLAVFAPLVLIAVAAGIDNPLIAQASAIYFFARLAHFVVYSAGIPVLRTLSFLAGFAAQVMVAGVILGWL
jgi:uncharacterized MAPEG superfamily protein